MTTAAAPPVEPGTTSVIQRAVATGRSTPALYRLASVVCVVALAVAALVAFLAARSLTDASDRARDNTGPVLVATQDVFASIAEADAASAAVFLSGTDEDREQRRLYEVALERATAQLEEVSRLVGDDDADHDIIKAIAADLIVYAGQVEAARLANVEGIPGATDRLTDAIQTVQDGVVPQVQAITAVAQERLDDDVRSGRIVTVVALLALVIAGAVLVTAQVWLSRRTNRLLNLPLVGATLLVTVAVLWLLIGWVRQQSDLSTAQDDGYDSIALTADIQTTAFRYKTLESLGVLAVGDATEQDELAAVLAATDIDEASVAAARDGSVGDAGLLFDAARAADSVRERAAAAEMLTRWQRYLDTSRDIRDAIDAGDRDNAVATAIGPGNADFNGFNTSVESVLSDNRAQFAAGLANADDRLRLLVPGMILLPVLAGLLALWGWQIRIAEYRR